MHARISTVAFLGIDIVDVDVQVHLGGGGGAFLLVGLAVKTIAESRVRVRAALAAIGLALPVKRITVNLSPADLHKEGSHYDLPIALGLMTAMGIFAPDQLDGHVAIGELALDGRLRAVAGVLPAAVAAGRRGRGGICPEACGGEAAWSGAGDVAVDGEIPAGRRLVIPAAGQRQRPPLRITVGPHRLPPDARVDFFLLLGQDAAVESEDGGDTCRCDQTAGETSGRVAH
jgi:hypothetical protein